MQGHQTPGSGTPASTAWARRARLVAFGAWALAALAPGAAVALAHDASLTPSQQQFPLNMAAGLILWLGLGLALFGWSFWAVVQILRPRTGYRSRDTTGHDMLMTTRVYAGSIGLVCAAGVLAAVGVISDSRALPALLALGLGVAGMIAGSLGILKSFLLLLVQGMIVREDTRARTQAWRRERPLEAARSQERARTAMKASTRWRFALSLLGSLTGMVVLFANPLVVLPVAHLFHLSAAAGLGLVLVVSAVVLFISVRALLIVGFLLTYDTLFPVAAVRRYARGTATVVTTAFLLWGILINTELAFLAVVPLVPLLFAQPILRKHYGVSLENLL